MRKRNPWNGTCDSALGWSFVDQQPFCISFLSRVVQLQQWLTAPHNLIFKKYFLPRIYDKNISKQEQTRMLNK
jgi:hypothetical protein